MSVVRPCSTSAKTSESHRNETVADEFRKSEKKVRKSEHRYTPSESEDQQHDNVWEGTSFQMTDPILCVSDHDVKETEEEEEEEEELESEETQKNTIEDENESREELLYARDKRSLGRTQPVLVVPDGGWGWLVAFGSHVILAVVMAQSLCYAFIFSGLLKELDTATAISSWVFNLQLLLGHLSYLFVPPLTSEFGWRRVGILGACLLSAGFIISAFSPSAELLFLSYSVMSGTGGGLLSGMAMIITPLYFYRRRGLANTVAYIGGNIGSLLSTKLLPYLLDRYGFRGSTLIFGAMTMNTFVGVALFHPLHWHMKKIHQEETESSQEGLTPLMTTREDAYKHSRSKTRRTLAQQETQQIQLVSVSPGISKCSEDSVTLQESDAIGLKTVWRVFVRVVQKTKTDLCVLRNYRTIILCLCYTLIMNSFLNMAMLTPFVLLDVGQTLSTASSFFFGMICINLLSRLVFGPLSDWKKFNMHVCVLLSFAVYSSAVLGFSCTTDATWILVSMIFMGVGSGVFVPMQNLVVLRVMGVEDFPAAFAVTSVIQGLCFPVTGTLLGYLADVTGSFVVTMRISAAMGFVSCGIWLLMPAAVAYDKRRRFKTADHPRQEP